ncbi:DNA-directed RNA polymerase specialized sigma24 family protein [Streptomyces phaeochromogenes]|jgi:DNA-directed RNA polymerase specialized sigma24 family protein|uniref:sigma factor n=2 Tax=Streptomyces TaxID=1883 RepID=UPI0027934F42|nr:sigma factor [Streptomyces phaeochromogenes]MDQ0946410.1 DNA-directed RNA polymerase specialized sigma24 family protein [Streptomyces phaeochromogenes]
MPATTDMCFEQYVRERHGALRQTAHRLVADPWDTEDLLQNALMATYRSCHRIECKTLADAYVRRTMYNCRTESWRARRLEETLTAQVPEIGVHDDTDLGVNRRLLLEVLALLPHQQ